MPPNLTSQNFTLDTLLQLKDAGLIAASAAAQVGGSARVIDLMGDANVIPSGAIPPEMRGTILIDVSAIEIATGDEKYTVTLQLSSSSTFASDIANLCSLELGAATPLLGGATVVGTTGRFLLPFYTNRNGTTRRYARLYTTVVGTIATGINYQAWMTNLLRA